MPTAPKSKAKQRKDNSTGYRGVTKDSKGNFVAQIYFEKKTHVLYRGKNKVKAAQAYDEKAKEIFGERAKLNFPAK